MEYFDIPKPAEYIIKVIGVGGGGSNTVENMHFNNIEQVELIICNTDRQALDNNKVEKKILIGVEYNDGDGTGAVPELGAKAATESKDELRKQIEGAKMVFITAGMGGGTGTGASPIIAAIAKELDVLVIGIVTMPFEWEGKEKRKQATKGIQELNKSCDSTILIYNDKINEIYPNDDLDDCFKSVDDILLTATKSIVEIVTKHRRVNVDIKDVYTTMRNSGTALMGIYTASGENKAEEAIKGALLCPLLGIENVLGAKKALISITVKKECKFTSTELNTITNHLKEKTQGAEIILGWGKEEDLDEDLMVTVIITGFKNDTIINESDISLNIENININNNNNDVLYLNKNENQILGIKKNENEEIETKIIINDAKNDNVASLENQQTPLFNTKNESEQQLGLFNSTESRTTAPTLSKTPPSNVSETEREKKIKRIEKLRKEKIKLNKDGKLKRTKSIYKPTLNKDKWANPLMHEVEKNIIDVAGNIRPNSYIHDKPD